METRYEVFRGSRRREKGPKQDLEIQISSLIFDSYEYGTLFEMT
jgi:hypothetical protein